MSQCGHAHDCGGHGPASLGQTLDEMDFERGIWSAAMTGETSEVEKHIKRGICVNLVDSYGFTALHYASRNGHTETCRMLLKSGANCNSQTRAGRVTPLHRAAYRGHLEIVKLLVDSGGKPELTDADERNALHKAAENGSSSVISYLMKHFPHLSSCPDKHGKCPSDYVVDKHQDLLPLFQISNHKT